jgi:hypothetical protein
MCSGEQMAQCLKGLAGSLKYIRLIAGFAALFVGAILALPLVPGPGIPLMLLGLMLLSDHFVWAKRALGWAKRQWKRLHRK